MRSSVRGHVLMLASLAAITVGGCESSPFDGRPPEAKRLTCPPMLVLTGSEYEITCDLDFSTPDRDVYSVGFKALDSTSALWTGNTTYVNMPGVREGTVSFMIGPATAPPLGPLTIKAELETDEGLTSNTITATVNVVAP